MHRVERNIRGLREIKKRVSARGDAAVRRFRSESVKFEVETMTAQRLDPLNPKRSPGGFTLLELIIVLAIITILLSIAIPAFQMVIYRAEETVLKQNLYLMRRQIEQFAADRERYPRSLQELVDEGYLREIPVDPITNSTETWQEIGEEGPPLGGENQPGIKDVKSGAEGESTDGTPYSEW